MSCWIIFIYNFSKGIILKEIWLSVDEVSHINKETKETVKKNASAENMLQSLKNKENIISVASLLNLNNLEKYIII